MPYWEQAKASALPHWPAPVSVVSRLVPSRRVVVRLRDRGVRLVRPGRGDPLVLVVDPRRGVQRLLQPARPVQRGGPPQPVDVEHVGGDVDEGVGGHFLADELHREQRRQVLRAHRLERPRVQRRGRRSGQVGYHVVPLARDLGLIQGDLGALGHDGLLPEADHLFRTVSSRSLCLPARLRASLKAPPSLLAPSSLASPSAPVPLGSRVQSAPGPFGSRRAPSADQRLHGGRSGSVMAFFASEKYMLVLGSKYSSFSRPA